MDDTLSLSAPLSNWQLSQALELDSGFLQPYENLWSSSNVEHEQNTRTNTLPHIDSSQYTRDTLGMPDLRLGDNLLVAPAPIQPLAYSEELAGPLPRWALTQQTPLPSSSNTTEQRTAGPSHSNRPTQPATGRAPKRDLPALLPKPDFQQPSPRPGNLHTPSSQLTKRSLPDWNVDGIPNSLCGGFQIQLPQPKRSPGTSRRAAKTCMRCSVQKLGVSIGGCGMFTIPY